MKHLREKWSDLEVKTKIAYITALVAFVLGWGLTIAGFIVPPVGAVADSILWILGQALVYAASVLGIGMYVTGSVKGMKEGIRDFMRKEDRYIRGELEEEEVEEDEQIL